MIPDLPVTSLQSAIGQWTTPSRRFRWQTTPATLANDGKRMRSHLVKSIESYNLEETVSTTEPEMLNQVEADQDAFEQVRQGMLRASRDTTRGTARYYFGDYPIDVASKTGTPQATGSDDNATSLPTHQPTTRRLQSQS